MKDPLSFHSILLVALLLCPHLLSGQPGWPASHPPGWFWQNPLPQGNDLYGISFASQGWSTTTTAVGAYGTILRTTNGGVTFVEQARNAKVPSQFVLRQNYPNPFNPTTNFGFRIANCGIVSLKVFDVLGREVAALMNEVKQPGEYDIMWNASKMPSGVYFYRLTAGSFSQTRKLVLLR